MERPHFQASIADLEARFKEARQSGDVGAIALIIHELTFRSSQRAQQLARLCSQALGGMSCNPASSAAPAQGHARSASRPGVGPSALRAARTPTDEQAQATEQFLKGQSFKINAFAGAGKTSTLEMMAQATERRGQYIAFNKSIADEAKSRFPRTVACSTVHGLAHRGTPAEYRSNADKMIGRINVHKVVELLQLQSDWRIDKDHVLKPVSQAVLIQRTLRRFTQSSQPIPENLHVPVIGALVGAPKSTLEAVREFAVRGAAHLWSRMLDPTDPVPLGHDGYLKLWALSEPLIAAEYILLDEAQDTNEVVLDVLRKQKAQIVYVGDKYQQIYEWRGAVNAMEAIETPITTYLTMSFRFGAEIARAASRVLTKLGEHVAIVGNPRVESRVNPIHEPRAVLARTNATTISSVIEALDDGKRPHLAGGPEELLEMLRGVEKLKRGEPCTVPDFFGFENWQQVVAFATSGEGEHLMTFVKLVEARGEKQLMWALGRTVAEDSCDLIISTAHKAKGREWPTVRLMDDFLRSHPKERPAEQGGKEDLDPSELRLFYVAVTRASLAVEIPEALGEMFAIPVSSGEGNRFPGGAATKSETGPKHADTKQTYIPRVRTSWSPPVNWTPQLPKPAPTAEPLSPPVREARSDLKPHSPQQETLPPQPPKPPAVRIRVPDDPFKQQLEQNGPQNKKSGLLRWLFGP